MRISDGSHINCWLLKTTHARSLGCEINEGIALKTTGVEMC
jgi:hypothetical protein